MKISILILTLAILLVSCKKDTKEQDRTINGVNVNIAVSTFNSFRTKGISNYPSVAAVSWNDTLSLAAYNFAKAKAEDIGTSSNVYSLSNGQFILDFPRALNYSRLANFALHYSYAEGTDLSTVIGVGFASDDQTILDGLMSSKFKQFGMGDFEGELFLIMSN